MRIYISGKITGLNVDYAKQLFKNAQERIEATGCEAVNPFDIIPYSPELVWEDYMIADIRELFKCDAIYMLENWQGSKGARIEHAIAKEMDLLIIVG